MLTTLDETIDQRRERDIFRTIYHLRERKYIVQNRVRIDDVEKGDDDGGKGDDVPPQRRNCVRRPQLIVLAHRLH